MYGAIYYFLHALRLIGVLRWKVEGLENLPPRNAGGIILVSNHIDWIDIPAIGMLLPFAYRLSWLAKIEIFDNPFAAWWFRQMKVIPIKRGRRDLGALEAAEDALRAGAVMLIYPEGHRSRDGKLQQGRGGAVRLAMRAGCPIVPMGIIGSEVGLGGALRGKPVTLRIGQPYKVMATVDGRIPPDQMEQLTTNMMHRIAALIPPHQHGFYAAPITQTESTLQ
jgi:1-acyl-sn-glycerol-3-phosphate acyltransferase